MLTCCTGLVVYCWRGAAVTCLANMLCAGQSSRHLKHDQMACRESPYNPQIADLQLYGTCCCFPTSIETFVSTWRRCRLMLLLLLSSLPSSLPAPQTLNRFVEQEVNRVKQLFERKESRLRSERDEAAQQAEAAATATAHLEAKVGWQQTNAEHQTCLVLYVGDQLATAPWLFDWDQAAERWSTVTERNCQRHPTC